MRRLGVVRVALEEESAGSCAALSLSPSSLPSSAPSSFLPPPSSRPLSFLRRLRTQRGSYHTLAQPSSSLPSSPLLFAPRHAARGGSRGVRCGCHGQCMEREERRCSHLIEQRCRGPYGA
eukprot:2839539-Rhodomonas_salina.3